MLGVPSEVISFRNGKRGVSNARDRQAGKNVTWELSPVKNDIMLHLGGESTSEISAAW
jgi:hypothetical protein